MQDQSPALKAGIRFDATINLGHILTFAGFIIAGFGLWTTLDKRVVILEEGRKLQAAIDNGQDKNTVQAVDQLTNVVLRLDRQVERLNDRLDKTDRSGGSR